MTGLGYVKDTKNLANSATLSELIFCSCRIFKQNATLSIPCTVKVFKDLINLVHFLYASVNTSGCACLLTSV